MVCCLLCPLDGLIVRVAEGTVAAALVEMLVAMANGKLLLVALCRRSAGRSLNPVVDHIVESADAGESVQGGSSDSLVAGLAGLTSLTSGSGLKLDIAIGVDDNVFGGGAGGSGGDGLVGGGRRRSGCRLVIVGRAQKEEKILIGTADVSGRIVVRVIIHLLANSVVRSAGHIGAREIGGLKEDRRSLEGVAVDVGNIVPHLVGAGFERVLELGDVLLEVQNSLSDIRRRDLQRDTRAIRLAVEAFLVANGLVGESDHRLRSVADRPEVDGEIAHVDDGSSTLCANSRKGKRGESDGRVGVLHFDLMRCVFRNRSFPFCTFIWAMDCFGRSVWLYRAKSCKVIVGYKGVSACCRS